MRSVIGPGTGPGPHIAVLLYGSRGDVQPGVCLALELQRRNHRVSLVVPPNLVAFATTAGVDDVHAIGRDTDRQWSSEQAMNAQKSSNPLARARFALDTVRDGISAFDAGMRALFTDPDAPLAGIDLVVAAPLCQARALAVSERLRIPLVVLRYAPMSRNGSFGPETGLLDDRPQRWVHRAWDAYDRWCLWRRGRARTRFGAASDARRLQVRARSA